MSFTDNEIFTRVRVSCPLIDYVRSVTTLSRALNGPCPMCGGRDRFYVVRSQNKCGCRKCGFHGDVIDLHAAIRNITTGEALKQLDNDYQVSNNIRKERPRELIPADLEWKTEGWQKSAIATVEMARRDLLASEEAKAYLAGRGISMETAYRYSLGSGTRMNRLAVCLPWYAPDGRITNIKWRFIDQEQPRYISKGGGSPIMFGTNGFHEHPIALAVIEGEINAISVGSVMPIDAVSIGAETNVALGTPYLKKLAKNYQQILVWTDEMSRAKELSAAIGATAYIASNKDGRGYKLDANALMSGTGGFCSPEVLRGILSDILIR